MGQDEGAEPNSGHIAALTALRGLKIAMFMLAGLGLCLSVSKLRGFTAIPGGLVQVKLWPGLLGWLLPLFLRWGRGTPSRHMALHVCFEKQRNWPDPGPTSLCQSLQDHSGMVLWEADGKAYLLCRRGQVSGPQLSHSLCQLPVENGHLFLTGHAQYGWAVPIVPRTSWQRGAKE